MSTLSETEILPFESAKAWEKWLQHHHTDFPGIWLKIAKKASGIATVTYDEALDVALCYGWIDGLKRTFDENYFIQKFTPRRAKSLWSKRNVGKVADLIKSGKMQPAGLAEVIAAKQDGRWQAAYDSQKEMSLPADFIKAVSQDPKAKEFLASLSKANIYAISWRLQTAKTEKTRARRFEVLLEMLRKRQKIHP